jgi:Ulp1 family protease
VKDRHTSRVPNDEKCAFFNTYAYPKLRQLFEIGKIEKFDRVLKRKNISKITDYDKLFIPVNIEKHHWLLLVVYVTLQRFEFYDSVK